MYHYIIDQSRIPERQFDKLIGQVHGFLTEYQVSGEVHRVTRLRPIEELIESAIRANARTIIGVGDDATFLQMVDSLAGREGIVAGFIPLQAKSRIAETLGLSGLADSCRALAQRRIETFSLGQVNRSRFFQQIMFGSLADIEFDFHDAKLFKNLVMARRISSLAGSHLSIQVDNTYTMQVETVGGLVNKSSQQHLQLVLLPRLSLTQALQYGADITKRRYENIAGSTVVYGQSFEIASPSPGTVVVDDSSMLHLPVQVRLSDDQLRVIVGKRKG